MKKLLLVFIFLSGCRYPIYPKTIEDATNKCSTNEGINWIFIDIDMIISVTFGVRCKNDAVFHDLKS